MHTNAPRVVEFSKKVQKRIVLLRHVVRRDKNFIEKIMNRMKDKRNRRWRKENTALLRNEDEHTRTMQRQKKMETEI